jgi:predicted metalloprotease
MRLGGGVDTSQVEDRRGLGPVAIGGGGLGIVGLLVVLLVNVLGGGGTGGGASNNPFSELQGGSSATGSTSLQCDRGPDTSTACFVTAVVNDVQRTWEREFQSQGRRYQPTKLVLFSGSTQSGCGYASSSTGPFYCPVDSKVYLDLGFFDELKTRFGAPGDFAQAYVVAHEFGHHVQNLLGTSQKVSTAERRDPSHANEWSVRLELQADCFAGVWAHDTSAQLDPGDFREGLDAAASVGDDRLQRQAGQRVNPDSWTHGSSDERMQWFQRGGSQGDPADCDTFSG